MADHKNGPRTSTEVFHHAADLPADVVGMLEDAEQTHDDLQLGRAWFGLLESSVFAGNAQVRYFVLRMNGAAVAVLPTLLRPSRAGNDMLALGNFYTSWYHPPFADHLSPVDLRPLLEAIRHESAPLRSIQLMPMDPSAPVFGLLQRAFREAGYANFDFYCFGNWYLDNVNDWQHYLAGRDGKMRGTIKRMTKRLLDQGGRLDIFTDPTEVARGIAAYEAVYARSWKVPEPYPSFVPGLINLCASHGLLRLGVVWLRDVPIAAQLWIVRGRKASIYKLAYDEAYSEHSPGTVLSAALMQRVLDVDKVSCVDFLSGDDPYKKKWMSHRRERWGLVAYDQRTAWGLIAGCREGVIRTVKPVWLKVKALRRRASTAGKSKTS